MFDVPAVTPVVTMPLVLPMLAIVVLLLLHVPPDVASVRVLVPLTHALNVPDIAAGNGLTVSTEVFCVVQVNPETDAVAVYVAEADGLAYTEYVLAPA